MAHKHHNDKHHPRSTDRGKGKPIGMVAERSSIATFLAIGLVGFVALSLIVLVVYMVFG